MLPLLSYDALANTSSTFSRNYNKNDDDDDDDSRRTITAASGLHSSRRKSSDDSSSSGSSDTLVDGLSIASISSCGTFRSEGGDAYKCARNEFVFRKNVSKNKKTKCSTSITTDVDVPFKSR